MSVRSMCFSTEPSPLPGARVKNRRGPRLNVGLIVCVATAMLAVTVAAVPGAAEQFELDRALITSGQWYRLLSGHFTHFGGSHLGWDVITLLVLGSVASLLNARRTVWAIALSAVVIPLAILIGQPELEVYRGLSGIDSALFALLATLLLKRAVRDRRFVLAGLIQIAIIGFFAKTAYEFLTGGAVFVDTLAVGFVAVPLAHAAGAVCGAVVGLPGNRSS